MSLIPEPLGQCHSVLHGYISIFLFWRAVCDYHTYTAILSFYGKIRLCWCISILKGSNFRSNPICLKDLRGKSSTRLLCRTDSSGVLSMDTWTVWTFSGLHWNCNCIYFVHISRMSTPVCPEGLYVQRSYQCLQKCNLRLVRGRRDKIWVFNHQWHMFLNAVLFPNVFFRMSSIIRNTDVGPGIFVLKWPIQFKGGSSFEYRMPVLNRFANKLRGISDVQSVIRFLQQKNFVQ